MSKEHFKAREGISKRERAFVKKIEREERLARRGTDTSADTPPTGLTGKPEVIKIQISPGKFETVTINPQRKP